MSISYLSMTKQKCKEMGRDFWKTEVWNPFAHVRQDLFGFADAVCLAPQGIIAIQCTGPSGFNEHKDKILASDYARKWLRCGGFVELWGWRQLLKKRGGKAKKWEARIEQITLADFS